MLGIHGLDPFGLAHAIIGLSALAIGWNVIALPKGSSSHRVWGAAYVISMVLLNASALAIYDFSGRFNVFHALAFVSLATLAAGWWPALVRRPIRAWYERHATFMAWSYVGLVAAFAAEIVVRIPAFRRGALFGAAIGIATATVIGIGAIVINRRVPQAASRFANS